MNAPPAIHRGRDKRRARNVTEVNARLPSTNRKLLILTTRLTYVSLGPVTEDLSPYQSTKYAAYVSAKQNIAPHKHHSKRKAKQTSSSGVARSTGLDDVTKHRKVPR